MPLPHDGREPARCLARPGSARGEACFLSILEPNAVPARRCSRAEAIRTEICALTDSAELLFSVLRLSLKPPRSPSSVRRRLASSRCCSSCDDRCGNGSATSRAAAPSIGRRNAGQVRRSPCRPCIEPWAVASHHRSPPPEMVEVAFRNRLLRFEGHRWSLLLSAPREEQGEIIPEMADAWKFSTEPFMIG
jgi:hypothetical protein